LNALRMTKCELCLLMGLGRPTWIVVSGCSSSEVSVSERPSSSESRSLIGAPIVEGTGSVSMLSPEVPSVEEPIVRLEIERVASSISIWRRSGEGALTFCALADDLEATDPARPSLPSSWSPVGEETREEVSESAILIEGGAGCVDLRPSADTSGETGADSSVSIALSSSSGRVASRDLYLPLLIFQHRLHANAFSPSRTSTEVNALKLSSRPVSVPWGVVVVLLLWVVESVSALGARSLEIGSISAELGGGASIR
jgi:hypothetical protein